jgi:hypothetical protein
VCVIDIPGYGFSIMKYECIWDVVHEQKKVVGTGSEILIDVGQCGWILTDIAGSGGDCAVHANAVAIDL